MIPTHRAIHRNQVGLLIVHVDTTHLRRVQASIAATEATATTTAEATVTSIVGVAKGTYGHHIIIVHSHQTSRIAVLRTDTYIVICHEALIHAFLHSEVEGGFLVTIVDTRDTAQVALLIVNLDALDDRCRQVLHGRLRIAGHKLLTTHLHFLHLFSVDGDLTVVVDLCTGNTLHQFLSHRAFRHAIGSRIIDECVFLQHHFLCKCRHLGTFQHHGISRHRHRSHSEVLVPLHLQVLHRCDVTDA